MASNTKGNTQRVIHPDDVNQAERLKMALTLRRQRYTYQDIADKAGYASRGAARNAIKNALKKDIRIETEEYRQQELEILDELHQKVWDMTFNKGEAVNLWAVDRLLKMSESRRELLNLDVQPEEVEGNTVIIREVPMGLLPKPVVEGKS